MNERWIKSALIGVQTESAFEIDGAIGALLARVSESPDPALNFARGSGVLAACELASRSLDPSQQPLPAPAKADPNTLSRSHPWMSAITEVFASGPPHQAYEARLIDQACRRLADVGLTLPPILLPTALHTGQRSQALRSILLPVLGPRGRWLAAQNPDWKYAASVLTASDEDSEMRVWQEANHLDRLAFFRRLRASSAGEARELLQASLSELAATERADFVSAMNVNLHADDAHLLDPLLKDRSRDVRFAAARLLACLPDSAHAQRLIGWVAALLVQKRGLLGKSWQLDAPQSANPTWGQSAIEATRPQHDPLGERAWWLYQLVRQVPLGWWTAQTGMNPQGLVTWAIKSDWSAALIGAWQERVDAKDPEWVEALLGARKPGARTSTSDLLALLPVAQREKHWPNQIDALNKDGGLNDVIASCAPGETLSCHYSKALLTSMLTCFEDDRLRHDYGLRVCLLELASLLHPDALGRVIDLPRRADETPAMADCTLAFERIIHVRAALHTHP